MVFTNDVGSSHTGTGSLGINANDLTVNDVFAGRATGAFSYAVTDSAGLVRALLNTLASDSKVKVLSSPHVMVVDNQQAVIRVGTQQPIPSGTTTTNNVTTSGGVEYKDTGVLLEVLPRVNSGGMVNMEIKQEVIDLGPLVETTQSSSQSISSRSFLQRSVTSKVVVKSGQTLVLGVDPRQSFRRTERVSDTVQDSGVGSAIRQHRRTGRPYRVDRADHPTGGREQPGSRSGDRGDQA